MARPAYSRKFDLPDDYFDRRPSEHPIHIPNFAQRNRRAELKRSLMNLAIILGDTDRHREIFEFMMNFPMGDLLLSHYAGLPILSHPTFKGLYARRSLPDFTTEGAHRLLQEEPGTLGHAYGRFVVERGLRDDFLSYVEEPTDPLRYFVFRMVLLHDLVHFLLGFEPGVPGDEMAVEAFLFAQTDAWNHLFFLQGYALNLLGQRPALLLRIPPRIRLGRSLGLKWPSLCLIEWQSYLSLPLPLVRQELGLI